MEHYMAQNLEAFVRYPNNIKNTAFLVRRCADALIKELQE
nr:MAG TPA: hypothetical protein [Caudoviricetes sp.]